VEETDGSICLSDGSGIANYANNELCIVHVQTNMTLYFEDYRVENFFDYLQIDDVQFKEYYPSDIYVSVGSIITWRSDYSISFEGFRLCNHNVPFDRCENTCDHRYTSDADCDDGGPNSQYDICQLGTDCTDCGPRSIQSSRHVTPRHHITHLDILQVSRHKPHT
jgi:hypothetical protein